MQAAENLLSQLQAQGTTEPDISFEISMFELDLLMRRNDYPLALSKLDVLIKRGNNEGIDILHRIQLLTKKAQLLCRCGVPLKGFSAAVRAASAAWRARLLPALWEALNAVVDVLIHLKEFHAAARILHAIMPQVRIALCSSIDRL